MRKKGEEGNPILKTEAERRREQLDPDLRPTKKAKVAFEDLKFIDLFAYRPVYTFQGYRSLVGAVASVMLWFTVTMRILYTLNDFITLPPVTTETREKFQRDLEEPIKLAEFGVVFKKNGWRSFHDESFFTFKFEQCNVQSGLNMTCLDMGHELCSFVDMHGRIIEDEARCPQLPPTVLGSAFDSQFMFVKVSLLRCFNGTDKVTGKAQAGSCRPPKDIDKLIWEGTVSAIQDEIDLDARTNNPMSRIKSTRRQFVSNIHISTDFTYTTRIVRKLPRYFWDRFDGDQVQTFSILESVDETMTNFRPVVMGKWNLPDPQYIPSYATFWLLLGPELTLQTREPVSLFKMLESWGASFAFFYILFSIVALKWNTVYFSAQVKGIDLRDLERSQFDKFGRLIDKSFQMPLELADAEI